MAKEVGCGTDVEGEVGITAGYGDFTLRVVQGQRPQVVGCTVVGPDDDVLQRRIDGQHTVVLSEVLLRREVGRHLERLVGQLQHRHAVERIDTHLVSVVSGQQVPALVKQLQGVGADGALIALGRELPVADAQTAVRPDGTDNGVEILQACRHALQHHTLVDGGTFTQHAVHGERREEPTSDAVVVEHLGVGNVVAVRLWLTVDDDAKHVENGVAMPVERRALQLVAAIHAVLLPLPVQFLEGQLAVCPQRIDNPSILVKYLCWFHVFLVMYTAEPTLLCS